MVICDEKCALNIFQYLDSPIEKIQLEKNGILSVTPKNNRFKKIVGPATAIITLCKHYKPELCGNSAEDDAVVRQWLEYAFCYANYCDNANVNQRILKEMSNVLGSRTYFAGTCMTIADVVLYNIIYNVMTHLSHQEKEQYVHLSRWFKFLQKDDKLRQSNKLISFSRMSLYS